MVCPGCKATTDNGTTQPEGEPQMPTTRTTAPVAETAMPTRINGSNMAHLHLHPTLRPALRTLPGWAELIGHLAYLVQNQPTRVDGLSLEDELAGAVADAVQSRKVLDLCKVAGAIVTSHRARDSLAQALRDTERTYARELDSLVQVGQQQLYAYLSGLVAEAVDRARGFHEQDPRLLKMTADVAIETDTLEQWKAMLGRRQDYTDAAAGVVPLKGRMPWTTPVVVRELEWISNPHEVYDHWVPWKVRGALFDPRRPHETTPLRAPFPDHRVITGDLAAAWFDYCVTTPNAKPWLPSESDYASAYGAVTPLLRQHTADTTPHSTARVATR